MRCAFALLVTPYELPIVNNWLTVVNPLALLPILIGSDQNADALIPAISNFS